MNEECLIWVEKVYSKIHKPYYVVSILISILIFLIFIFFTLVVPMLNLELWYGIEIASMATLIAWQQITVIHTLRNFKNIIQDLDFVSDDKLKTKVYISFRNIYKFKYILLINILIIAPFFVIDVVQISRGEANSFYLWMHTSWSLLLDLYNYFLSYVIDYLISIQLFINLSILYLILFLGKSEYINYVKLSILEKPTLAIARLLSVSTTFYFISLALAIMTYMSPLGLLTAQSKIYIILIFLGFFIFILSKMYLDRLFKKRIKVEIDGLYTINENYYENIFLTSSNQVNANYEDKLSILLKISIINIMIRRLIETKINIFSLGNLFQVTISFVSSIFAVLIKMTFASELANYILNIFSFIVHNG